MTVNLLNGEASPQDLEHVLQHHDPDIMLAQELAPNAGEVIERHFPHGVVKPVCDYRGKAIVAKTPISVEEVEFPFRSIMRGVMDDGLEILNVHLANPVDSWRGRLLERRRQVQALEDLISTSQPHILAGDFNSTPAWPAYRRINRLIDDTVADFARTSGTSARRTWGWRPEWPVMLRIDHVFASGFRATAVDVVKVRGTDHRAVIVDLERA
ncbi:MAG: endonuclease/exonuclease/phosphatase family protein [Acidimicrobiia bacterium]|nr:endonuclease/exonuclease/phosphatase family protein [Acidimicrobiia bacterium]